MGFANRVGGLGDLARANHGDVVSARTQALFQALNRQGYAIHFGRIGLGDDGVTHAQLPGFGELAEMACPDGFRRVTGVLPRGRCITAEGVALELLPLQEGG